jgi:hypothetical protein
VSEQVAIGKLAIIRLKHTAYEMCPPPAMKPGRKISPPSAISHQY